MSAEGGNVRAVMVSLRRLFALSDSRQHTELHISLIVVVQGPVPSRRDSVKGLGSWNWTIGPSRKQTMVFVLDSGCRDGINTSGACRGGFYTALVNFLSANHLSSTPGSGLKRRNRPSDHDPTHLPVPVKPYRRPRWSRVALGGVRDPPS